MKIRYGKVYKHIQTDNGTETEVETYHNGQRKSKVVVKEVKTIARNKTEILSEFVRLSNDYFETYSIEVYPTKLGDGYLVIKSWEEELPD